MEPADNKQAGESVPEGGESHPVLLLFAPFGDDKRVSVSARRSCGFAIRRQKRLDLFDADLKSASNENAQRRHEKPTAADCKSAGTPSGP